jgi:hypothetical protein
MGSLEDFEAALALAGTFLHALRRVFGLQSRSCSRTRPMLPDLTFGAELVALFVIEALAAVSYAAWLGCHLI